MQYFYSKIFKLPTAFLITALFSLFVGYRLGAFWTDRSNEGPRPLRVKDSNFEFINPLLGLDYSEKKNFVEFESLQKKIKSFTNDSISNGDVKTISVYFRDPMTGHWLGLNEDMSFLPGSLLKVPVMIAYFKEAEANPDILSKKLYYKGPEQGGMKPRQPKTTLLLPNRYYTIDELIRSMIIESDNEALYLLLDSINPRYIKEVFGDLGITLPQTNQYTMNLKTYSLFFRVLFNSTYLDREFSERALKLLSQTTFEDGMVAGVADKSISIAHKYGERGVYEDDHILGVELSDCGVVYYPGHPYLLCVMALGGDVDKLKSTISHISELAFEDIKKQY
ncbi:MAG: serine hydrolase [bacterium]|nr:serine hydrolase [bacterium]